MPRGRIGFFWLGVVLTTGCGGKIEHDSELAVGWNGVIIDPCPSGDPNACGPSEFVPDVKVCVYQRSDVPCATSDAEGHYVIRLPKTDVVLSFEKSQYHRQLWLLSAAEISSAHVPQFYFQKDAWVQHFLDSCWGAGTIQVDRVLLAPQATGQTHLLVGYDPIDDTAAAPAYVDNVSFTCKAPFLKCTGSLGIGFVANVTPRGAGYDVWLDDGLADDPDCESNGVSCAPQSFFGDHPGSAHVPAPAGWIVNVNFRCN